MRTRFLNRLCRFVLIGLLAPLFVLPAKSESISARPGWVVLETPYTFREMVERLNTAVKTNNMLLVTRASASAGARANGITIRGNMIVGVYRNDYARRMLDASVAAGIEAPIRFYLTEGKDGGTTLSYKTPTAVFAPYFSQASPDLEALASELDAVFDRIAKEAVVEASD